MFGRGRRKSSGNIRTMQLFHELKQKFPTVPDHVISACIASRANQINPQNQPTSPVQFQSPTTKDTHMGLSPENTAEPFLDSEPANDTPEETPAQSPTEEGERRVDVLESSTKDHRKKSHKSKRSHDRKAQKELDLRSRRKEEQDVRTSSSASGSSREDRDSPTKESPGHKSHRGVRAHFPKFTQSLPRVLHHRREHNYRKESHTGSKTEDEHSPNSPLRVSPAYSPQEVPSDWRRHPLSTLNKIAHPLSKREYILNKIGYLPDDRGHKYRVTRPSSTLSTTETGSIVERTYEMNISETSDINRNVLTPKATYSKKFDSVSVSVSGDEIDFLEKKTGKSSFFMTRPNSLNLNNSLSDSVSSIPKSERCSDVHKLLNSEISASKPPRSPLREKRFTGSAKNSPTRPEHLRSPLTSPESNRRNQQICSPESPSANQPPTSQNTPSSTGAIKKTDYQPKLVETPTQTTDTLIGGIPNLSLNVQCSVDLVQTPTHQKCKTSLEVVPQQPWCMDQISPRSYTSVNLTLRPPSSEPQAPIDITSHNSSLTYSTSSFDRQNGLQSRLQITVGPGGSSSVSSVRTRPRSSCTLGEHQNSIPVMETKAGSCPDLAGRNAISPVVIKQQARIERLRIELKTEKTKHKILEEEVAALEHMKAQPIAPTKEQLEEEIKMLREQCELIEHKIQLQEQGPNIQNHPVYNDNFYTGQLLMSPITLTLDRSQFLPPAVSSQPVDNIRRRPLQWNCHMCTFLNHPDLDKCEQCEMPRIVHVSAAPGDNIHIHVTPRVRRMVHSWAL